MNSTRILATVGVVAIIIIGVYFINESGKSDLEKFGDSVEDAADDLADSVNE